MQDGLNGRCMRDGLIGRCVQDGLNSKNPCRLLSETDSWADRIDFLQEVMLTAFERKKSQTETINAMPLYPTESILWDENQVRLLTTAAAFLL